MTGRDLIEFIEKNYLEDCEFVIDRNGNGYDPVGYGLYVETDEINGRTVYLL